MGFGGASCSQAPDPVIAPHGGTGGGLTAGTAAAGVVGTPVGGAGVGSAPGGRGGGGSGSGGAVAAGTSAPAAGSGGQKAGGTGGSAAGSGGAVAAGRGGSAGSAGMATGGSGGASPMDMCVADAAARGSTGVCPQCACAKCRDKLTNCKDDACVSVVRCGEMSGCQGRACYCGNQSAINCALQGATGSCMMEIAKASGVCDAGALDKCAQKLSNVTDPMNSMYDANNPVSRANQVSICTRGQKAEPAGIGTSELLAIMGMCETECAK
jgi:hypothetical protein